MRKWIYVFSLLLLGATAYAQDEPDTEKKKKEKKGIVYDKEFSVDFRLHTNGFALAGNYGIIQTYYKTRLFQVEFAEMRHPREARQRRDFATLPGTPSPKSFVYGKQNNFYAMHLGYGGKRYFSEKAKRRGVAVGMSYLFGPSIGFIKPYYLELAVLKDGGPMVDVVEQRYSEENAALFLDEFSIVGGAGFIYGLGEMKFNAGGFGKVGLHFDWGAYDQFIKALDIGFMVDVYYKKVPIMITEDNSFLFMNAYIAIEFGKRW